MKKINLEKLKAIKWPKFKKIRKDALLAILSYFHILVLIPLIFGRKDEFVKYHAKQGFILLVFWVLFGFSLFLPYLPWLFFIVIVIGFVSGVVYVILGKEKPMPIIGKLALKMNL